MPLAPELLEVLVCPQTRGPLLYVPAATGQAECLLSEQARAAYRIDDGVPVLLVEEAQPLEEADLVALRARAASVPAAT